MAYIEFTPQEGHVYELLQYAECSDIDTIHQKLYFWDFLMSLGESLEEYGRLTEKQYGALTRILDKQGATYRSYKLISKSKYKVRRKAHAINARKATKHSFPALDDIDNYDLPFEEGQKVETDIYYFNSSSAVLKHNKRYYKIPKPANLVLKQSQQLTISFTYHRTAYKGFLNNIKTLKVAEY